MFGRIVYVIGAVILVFCIPSWCIAVMLFLGIFLFPFFFEALIVALLLDSLFVSDAHLFPYMYTLASAVLLLISVKIKDSLRLYT